ncbi:hypothetical protein TRIUR3_20302 [Triticum urartu]|uniref:Uncharacterized protein n=1 Tax=Triticum urartu TaxID=4572 RepID=M8A7X9_TRIUA|nr:hypothetical protein TRIUR3_20302 [Triticum urartu]
MGSHAGSTSPANHGPHGNTIPKINPSFPPTQIPLSPVQTKLPEPPIPQIRPSPSRQARGDAAEEEAGGSTRPNSLPPIRPARIVRRKAAIRAIQAAENESVLSRLHLVRSYMSKEQLETPALQFFQENLPNVSVVRNEEQGELELKWKDWDDLINGDQRDDKVSRASITSLATAAGFHFSGDSVQKNFIESTFDFNNFNWSELPESQTIGAPDSLQTPGVCV